MSIADQIINGTYKKNSVTSSKSVADIILGDGFDARRKEEEEERLRRLREQREAKRQQEETKQEVLPKASETNKDVLLKEIQKNISTSPTKNKELSTAEKIKMYGASLDEKDKILKSEENLGDLKPVGKAVEASKDIKSEDASKRIPAKIRYTLEKGKAGAKSGIGNFFNWLQNETAGDYEKYADIDSNSLTSRLARATMSEEEIEEARKDYQERVKPKYIEPTIENAKVIAGNANSEQIYQQTLPKGLRTAGQVSETVGRMLPVIGASAVNPALGDVLMYGSTSGEESSRLVGEGETFSKANKVGNLKGAVEVGTEKIAGGVKFRGKGALDDIVGNTIANKTKTKVENFLATKGYQVAGEIGEEHISNIAGYAIDKIILNKDTSLKEAWEDAKETTKMTFLSTLALNVIGLGGESYTNNTTVNQQLINEYENITKTKLNEKQKNELLNEIDVISNEISNNRQAVENNQKGIKEILSKNGNFEEQVDKYVAGKLPSGDFLHLGETPTVLRDLGVPNNEIILKQNKLKTLMEESNNNTDKLHGLSAETIKRIPEAISKPLNILQSSSNENSIVVITDLADTYERPIIASIEINYNGQIGKIDFLSNRLTSAYGKNNYDRFMQTEIAKGNLLYDIDEGIIKELPTTRLQSPKGISSSIDTNNNVSTSTNSIASSTEEVNTTNNYAQNVGNDTQNNKNFAPTADNILATGQYTEGKQRKHYKSIIQSQYTTDEARAISKELMGSDTYVPESNNKQLERADQRISNSGADSELKSLLSRAMTGGNIKADDIAVGERLIQYYSKTGNKQKLSEAIQATAMAGTTAGQTVQAMSLLNHQTPQGQAIWLQRSVEKMNNELRRTRGDKTQQFNLTPEMTEKIVNSQNTEELNKKLDEVYRELGQQVSKTTLQKIDSWRYFSMLANPRTHIRNITGNVVMGKVQGVKNKVAGAIEGIASKINPDMERNHTIVPASIEVKTFAKKDIINVADRLELNENKYNPKTRLENSMRTFKSDVMENSIGKLFDINDDALSAEDGWGLKAGYVKALSEYMTANNLNPNTITDTQLSKARNYAAQQAKEATFHQASALATAINQFSNKNKITKFITDATLPFIKTPINVAKAGIEYSPVGLVKSAIYDTVQLRKGNITVNQYIDNISKGLTGTGITLLGYALSSAGILKADGDEDDIEKFEQDRGKQKYSVQIGDSTYSLDWLAPAGIPLFIGAKTHELMQQKNDKKSSSSDDESVYNKAIETATSIIDAFTSAVDPMTEMSMLSGLGSTLKSYDDNLFAGMATNMGKSYINQFVPTALGQIAKTTDKYERSTTSTKTGTLPKAIDSTKNQILSKIPGLRKSLPTKTDAWGNKLEQNNNVLLRGIENSVFPWTKKDIRTNNVDKELLDLYEKSGEKSVLPGNVQKDLTIDKRKYRLTDEEYSNYKQKYGETSYNLLNKMVSSSSYKKLSNSQKQKAIESAYEYAKEQIKVDYAKQNKLNYKESDLSNTVNAIKKANGNTGDYFEYRALTQNMTKEKEKIQTLADAKYSNITKKAIYENSIGKDDDRYNLLKTTGIDVTQYLKFKNQEFAADKKDDGTISGQAISGTKKTKTLNYINGMQGLTYTQKLLLYGYGADYKLSDLERKYVFNYVKSLNLSKKEKEEIISHFKGFTIYKDGTVKY